MHFFICSLQQPSYKTMLTQTHSFSCSPLLLSQFIKISIQNKVKKKLYKTCFLGQFSRILVYNAKTRQATLFVTEPSHANTTNSPNPPIQVNCRNFEPMMQIVSPMRRGIKMPIYFIESPTKIQSISQHCLGLLHTHLHCHF